MTQAPISISGDRPKARRIVVVSGLPCSGKSKLAALLCSRWQVPLLSKDVYKESLFTSLGIGDRDWSRRLSAAAYDLLFQQGEKLLACNLPCVLEGNFRPQQHRERFGRLRERGAEFIQVHCQAQADVLIVRFRERAHSRSRHPGHVDIESLPEITAEIARTPQLPLDLGGKVVSCDTTGDWNEAIERAVTETLDLVR